MNYLYNKYLYFVCALLVGCIPLFADSDVTNVTAYQDGKNIIIEYYLSQKRDIDAYVSINYGPFVKLQYVNGDIGKNIVAGQNEIKWDVLSQYSSFKYDNVRFKIECSQAQVNSNKKSATMKYVEDVLNKNSTKYGTQDSYKKYVNNGNNKNVKKQRQSHFNECVPMSGFDIHGGGVGFGVSAYWGYVYSAPSRWGSYVSFTCGCVDYTRDVSNFYSVYLGATCTLNRYCALFFAPGLDIANTNTGKIKSSTWYSKSYVYEYRCGFAAELGLGVRCASCFLMSFRISYPLYVGVGIGLDVGWY